MEEVKDLRLEDGKGPDAILSKLASVIPGFEGYKNREHRKKADKIHRDYVATRLLQKKKALQEIMEELMDNGQMDFMSKLDDLTGDIDGMANKVKAAVSGSASVFFDTESDTDLLDRVYEHDLALHESVEELDGSISTLSDAVDSEDNVKAAIKGVKKSLKTVESNLATRDKIIKGLE